MISNHNPNGWRNFHRFDFWLPQMPRFWLFLWWKISNVASKTWVFLFENTWFSVRNCETLPTMRWTIYQLVQDSVLRSMHSMTIDFFGQTLFWSLLTRLGSAAQRRTAVPRQAGWCCCYGLAKNGIWHQKGALTSQNVCMYWNWLTKTKILTESTGP